LPQINNDLMSTVATN